MRSCELRMHAELVVGGRREGRGTGSLEFSPSVWRYKEEPGLHFEPDALSVTLDYCSLESEKKRCVQVPSQRSWPSGWQPPPPPMPDTGSLRRPLPGLISLSGITRFLEMEVRRPTRSSPASLPLAVFPTSPASRTPTPSTTLPSSVPRLTLERRTAQALALGPRVSGKALVG
jgi:hypothetical protein